MQNPCVTLMSNLKLRSVSRIVNRGVSGMSKKPAFVLILAALLALAIASPGLAGGWAGVKIIDLEAWSAPVKVGKAKLYLQVLQHGHFPLRDAEVRVVALHGGQEQVVKVELQCLALDHKHEDGGESGHQHGSTGCKEHTEPVYVATFDVDRPGDWQLQITVKHALFLLEQKNGSQQLTNIKFPIVMDFKGVEK